VGHCWRCLKTIGSPKRETRQSRVSLAVTNTRHLSVFVPLFAVGMLVAPFPVVPLVSGSLLVIRAVSPMMLYEIPPIRMIFAVIPIMVIAMVRIIDSNLNAPLLRTGSCHDSCWHENSSCQQQ
jgi:hypothetical protein